MTPLFLSRPVYLLLFYLLSVVYLIGLFVPLMDNDSAHHANIALRMHLTGDYVNLVDQGKDYLDKPHLLFWMSALSYHVFGVTAFAYKFPSFLFSIFGIYATYRLGKTLYNSETGRLAALITASAFAYILANNDVRMEAMLTAAVALALWQGAEWVNHKKIIHALGTALGLALGFCIKGHIGVLTPLIGICFYVLQRKDWKCFYHPHLAIIILFFFILIAPVLYCYYLQFDQHPEKLIRGQAGRSGVRFILWQQIFERFEGKGFAAAPNKDYLFFFHSFLWVFAPWSILAYIAFFNRLKNLRTQEWLTAGTLLVTGLLINFSGFKLPHYLNIIFPVSAVLTAAFLLQQRERPAIL